METDSTNIVSILIWIVAGPGSVLIANLVISWLAANSIGWNNLPRNLKFVIMILIAPILAVIAQVLLQYTDFLATVIQPWFQIVMVAMISWLGTQSAYMKIEEADYKNEQP